MKNVVFAFIVVLYISSCTFRPNTEMDETRLESLSRMRINNSSKVFYTYSYAGLMAWSSSIGGRVLIDSTVVFSSKEIKNRFPSGYITNIDLNTNTIDMIEFIENESEIIDNGKYSKVFNDININIKQFFYKGVSTINFFYHSRNLSESSDSIYFDKIYKQDYDFGLDFKGKVGFRKGNIAVKEDFLGYVSEINFTLISQNPLWDDFVKDGPMATPKHFNGINEINLPPLSKVYLFKIELKPDSLSQNQRISDFGVYKKVK